MSKKGLKIALFSNTFGLRDAMGKHVHLIKRIFPGAQIFLERGGGDPGIKTHNYYFVKRYPFMSLYMLEWKLGRSLKLLEWLFLPLEKLAFSWEAKKLTDFDIIWIQWGFYHKAIHLLSALTKLPKRPKVIFDYHGVTPPKYILSRGKRLIAEKTIKVASEGADHADFCLVRSRFMARELKKIARPKKIVSNPLPFIGNPLSSCLEDLRKKYKLEGKKIILYVGRISAHKNLRVVIRALKLLPREDVVFVVVGNYRHRSLAREKDRLVALARVSRIPHRVIFTGELSEERLLCWYQTADFFVIPSLHEGFCWPLVDAMIYGKPIVASRFGAIPETVGEAALFFDARDPNDLKAKIQKLLSDQALRDQLVRQGQGKAKEYSWERYRRTLRDLLGA